MVKPKLTSEFCKLRAFSLIELMVVIAIVAVLAVIAVPAVQFNLIKSRAITVVPIIESIADKSIKFSQTHGRFANAYDLGLAATDTTDYYQYADNPKALSPYLHSTSGLYFGDYSNFTSPPQSSPCGAVLLIQGDFDLAALGFPQATVQNGAAYYGCYIFNKNGVLTKFCAYSLRTGAGSTYQVSPALIPGWNNFAINNSGTLNPDFTNSGVYQATCQ